MNNFIEELIIDGNVYKLYDLSEFDKNVVDYPYKFAWSIYFDQTLITVNDKPKYLIGLYQDGDIWSEDEIWGTSIADLDTIEINTEKDNIVVHGYNSCWYIDTDIKSILDFINKENEYSDYHNLYKS